MLHLSEGELQNCLDGELEREDAARVRDHLARCPDCGQRLDELRLAAETFSNALLALDTAVGCAGREGTAGGRQVEPPLACMGHPGSCRRVDTGGGGSGCGSGARLAPPRLVRRAVGARGADDRDTGARARARGTGCPVAGGCIGGPGGGSYTSAAGRVRAREQRACSIDGFSGCPGAGGGPGSGSAVRGRPRNGQSGRRRWRRDMGGAPTRRCRGGGRDRWRAGRDRGVRTAPAEPPGGRYARRRRSIPRRRLRLTG